jgi:hypothetical protein
LELPSGATIIVGSEILSGRSAEITQNAKGIDHLLNRSFVPRREAGNNRFDDARFPPPSRFTQSLIKRHVVSMARPENYELSRNGQTLAGDDHRNRSNGSADPLASRRASVDSLPDFSVRDFTQKW